VTSRLGANGAMVSSPLEDLFPFLDRDELRANMLVPLLDE
jgi:acetolactate synthase-1/2/3 large subunit